MFPEPVASGSVSTTLALPPTSPSNSVLPACSVSVTASVPVKVCIAGLKEPVKVSCELIATSPVPLAEMLRSALEPFEDITFVCRDPVVVVPSIVAPPLKVVAPVTPNVVETVAAPVTANVEPSKLKFPSAVIADVPVPVSTALSVKLDAPVPPSATAKSVIPVIVPLVIVTAPVTVKVPSTSVFSFICTADESELSIVVPLTLNALIKTSPVPLGCKLRSAFEPFDVTEFVIKLSAVTPSSKMVVPDTVKFDIKAVFPLTFIVPSTTNASLILTEVESDESRVVPLILKALIKTSPVPLGCIERSALDPLDAIVFVVTLFAVKELFTVAAPVKAAAPVKDDVPVTASVDVAVIAPSIFVDVSYTHQTLPTSYLV